MGLKYDKCIHYIDELPFALRDPEPRRIVRLVISPETTGDQGVTITHVLVPPGGISSGHVHDDSDEMIYFLNDGEVILDDEKYKVKGNSVVVAKRGVWHECVNTGGISDLTLFCIFIPALKPFDVFIELIEKTNRYLGAL